MENRLAPPKGKTLSTGIGVMSCSIGPGSPLWVAIETDDLPTVQALAAEIVECGVNIFSVQAAVLGAGGGVALVNVLGLACECNAVETAVWLYRQLPSFVPVECMELSTRGFLSIIEAHSGENGQGEIARRCLEWSFTHCHESRIRSGAPLKRLDAGPIAAALFLDIGLRLYAANEQKSLRSHIPETRLRPRAAGVSARL